MSWTVKWKFWSTPVINRWLKESYKKDEVLIYIYRHLTWWTLNYYSDLFCIEGVIDIHFIFHDIL
jgi:hypothetical protein